MVDVESNRLVAADPEEDSESEEEGDPFYAAQASCFRDTWNARYSAYFGHFDDTTKIPNKRFTFKKPGPDQYASTLTTLQIFSLKVARIRGGLQWPLHVFGRVAVRDTVDHNLNMIFYRPRESCQIFTRESRLLKRDYASKLSTLEFELGPIVHSVEATIEVRVQRGSWPDGFSAQFAARTASIGKAEVILLDCGDDKVPVAGDRSIRLSPSVVSVEIIGELEVSVKARRLGEIVADKKKVFKPKKDSASHAILDVGFCTMDVTISWSLISVLSI